MSTVGFDFDGWMERKRELCDVYPNEFLARRCFTCRQFFTKYWKLINAWGEAYRYYCVECLENKDKITREFENNKRIRQLYQGLG